MPPQEFGTCGGTVAAVGGTIGAIGAIATVCTIRSVHCVVSTQETIQRKSLTRDAEAKKLRLSKEILLIARDGVPHLLRRLSTVDRTPDSASVRQNPSTDVDPLPADPGDDL